MGETGPVTVTVAGQGYTSMPQVKGDKAMILVRQMIAAKLNRFWDCGCEKVKWAYREGEKWLLSDPQPGWGYIEGYKDILDAFNNGKWCP